MIALMLGGDSIPVHGMDTLDGLDMEDNPLHPDLYVPLTRSSARREKRSYRANTSQVTRIPHQERRAMFDALGMTSRRGSEVGLPHAAVLFNANNSPRNHDPIAELFPGAVTLNNHMQFA